MDYSLAVRFWPPRVVGSEVPSETNCVFLCLDLRRNEHVRLEVRPSITVRGGPRAGPDLVPAARPNGKEVRAVRPKLMQLRFPAPVHAHYPALDRRVKPLLVRRGVFIAKERVRCLFEDSSRLLRLFRSDGNESAAA